MNGCWVIHRFSKRADELSNTWWRVFRLGIVWAVSITFVTFPVSISRAQECGTETIADLTGSGNIIELSGSGYSSCQSEPSPVGLKAQPYFTQIITCSPDRQAAMEGLCSATPCSTSFFAFRTVHFPDGSSEPAGFRCVTLDQATASPGVTAAQVFEAIRRVKLPGGEIQITPQLRGLANLESFFRLQGANQPPVDLQVGGSTVHAEFRVLEYRWSFGDGRTLVTEEPGQPGLASEVRTAWPRRGRYQVEVTVIWVAQASLDGRPIGQVDDLVSQAQTTYPVAEIKTVITG
jgi:hypothetical protein